MSNPVLVHEEDMIELICWMRKAIHYDPTDGFYGPAEMDKEELLTFTDEGKVIFNRFRRSLGFALDKAI